MSSERPLDQTSSQTRGIIGWCLYDWANSAFPTVITTFVFAAYFTKAVAADPVSGTEQWSYAISASALAVAVTGPVLGAIADHAGARKPWIAVLTFICVIATAMLWFTRPDPSDIIWVLFFVALANYAFEMGMVFYNAMLADIAPKPLTGRISGWGWGLGYAGGLLCLAVALVLFVQPDPALFGLDKSASEPIRATALLVAVWFAVFSIPLFLYTPDAPASGRSVTAAVRRGLCEFIATIRRLRDYAQIVRFLIARMFYADGLTTLFAFGGIYAAGTFGMGFSELIVFGIALNVTAGLGAAAFGWVDDALGSKKTIMIAVSALIVLSTAVLLAPSKTWFWILAMPLGIFVGPAQAASRSMMTHLTPPDVRNEMFGLYALSGKATAFMGPALLGWVTAMADSQRIGMATILVFFGIGLLLLLTVRDIKK
ncbi:MAG: MFS transporter [Rhodospirillaceae bacterium]